MMMGGGVLHVAGLADGTIAVLKIHPNGCSEEQRTDGGWHGGEALGDVIGEIGEDLTAVNEDVRLTFDDNAAVKFDWKIRQGCVVDPLLLMRLLRRLLKEGRWGLCRVFLLMSIGV